MTRENSQEAGRNREGGTGDPFQWRSEIEGEVAQRASQGVARAQRLRRLLRQTLWFHRHQEAEEAE